MDETPTRDAPGAEPDAGAEPVAPGRGPRAFLARWGAWLGLALVLALAAQVRLGLLDVPLERDEGEYAYMGQLMLEGVPPYAEAYNMKLPGIYASYAAVLAVFGQTRQGIRVGLLVVSSLSTVLVFLIGRRLFGAVAGLGGAAAFAFLALSFGVQGPFANAEHFVLPWALFGIWLLLLSEERPSWKWVAASGFCLGAAFVVKQHGLGFPACGGLYLLVRGLRREPRDTRALVRRLALFTAAAAAPFLLACLALWVAGVFHTFWFWTVEYAGAYAGGRPLGELWERLRPKGRFVVREAPLVWGLAGVGLVAVFAAGRRARAHAPALLLLSLAGLSFLGITPGLHFRPHYFVLVLPAAALGVAAVCGALTRLFESLALPAVGAGLALVLAAAPIAHGVYRQWQFLFESTPEQVVWFTFGENPFYESIAISNFIAERTDPDDRIAVIGSEPQIYFYTRRRAATGFVYTYALMEPHRYALDMHRQMIAEIERNEPEFLVIVKVKTSWLATDRSEDLLLRWTEQYKQAFELVGLVEVRNLRKEGMSRFYQGAALDRYEGKPEQSVEIWQRRRR